jgi:iron-sulfur cluster repair protein YtfE (RIC family)
MANPETLADTRDMYMVHTMFRREFAALSALVRGVAPGDTERANQLAEHIGLLTAVLAAHHRAEDTHLWPKLIERGSEEVAPVVQAMERQHARIERLTVQTLAALGEWCLDASAGWRGLLADVLDGLSGELREHMGIEEQFVLPLAEKYVTAAEWHAMAGATGDGLPPGQMSLVFGMTLYEANPEVIEKTLSRLPSEVRVMLEEQGAREFSAHSVRIHGTPTPQRSTSPQKADHSRQIADAAAEWLAGHSRV